MIKDRLVRRFWVSLTIRKYEFLIGRGISRLDAIDMAIGALKRNLEHKLLGVVFAAKLATEKELADEIRVIKECRL